MCFDTICKKLKAGKDRGKAHSIIIKAEGVDIENKKIAEEVLEKIGQKTNIVVMSYLQRGGSPTAMDRLRASLMAIAAIKNIEREELSAAIGISRNEVVSVPIEEASEISKEADLEKLATIDMLSM